jgi:UDP-GlcNAc:undecaprenyl-phosphate/decaprenyl-phosphate GlcNAc-1-phosphate transferase
MLTLFIGFAIAFFVALALTPRIIRLAHQHGIFDDFNERKIHLKQVPRFGGAAIFGGVAMALVGGSLLSGQTIAWPLLLATTVVTLVGLSDDFKSLNHRYKLVPEILAALGVIYFADLRVTSLHGLFGVGDIPVWLGYVLTVFTVIVITNAFNLIDGIDGLAGTLAMLIFGTYGAWFFLAGNLPASLLCVGVVGASGAFLFFNFRTQIFMGDTGSLALGFLAAFMTIQFLHDNATLAPASPLRMDSPVLLTCCLLALPLYDTIRVFVVRIAKGRSPFSPDKNHLHHLLIAFHLPHYQATLALVGTNAVFALGAYLAQGIDTNLGLVLAILLATAICVPLQKQAATVQPKLVRLIRRERQSRQAAMKVSENNTGHQANY